MGADYAEALRLFKAALDLRPNNDEARAALYNKACAHARLKDWQEAADDVVSAVNDYGLKLEVAVKDPDLRALRERREWLDALEKAKGGVSTRALIGARAEARAPFRLARLFIFGGLGAGAALGLAVIAGRLIAALKGGEGAPELTESLLNFTINAAALAAFSWLFFRDYRAAEKDKRMVDREEALGRLLVQMGAEREVPLASFRGAARPVLLAGSAGYVSRALKASELYQTELRLRGISVIPLVLSSKDPSEKLRALKAEFRKETGEKSKGFGRAEPAAPPGTSGQQKVVLKQDRKWELKPAATEEWEAWAQAQKEAAGVTGDDFYVQIQLDGSVRRSGLGTPPWDKWLDDIPELDSLQTKLTDGIGRST
ncbi:g7120 [Coccomyxa elongata]